MLFDNKTNYFIYKKKGKDSPYITDGAISTMKNPRDSSLSRQNPLNLFT